MSSPIGNPRACPEVPEDLVLYLIATNPVRPPQLTESEREIFIEVGRQEIIAWLKHRLDYPAAPG